MATSPSEVVTEDAVLGGRLRLRQPKRGHRVGHDAILLAASCPARAGERAVDLGAGVGGAGLALATRIPGTHVTLVEIDAVLVALAAENIEANGLADRMHVVTLDVAAPARSFAAAGLRPGTIAHVLMNPPFNDPAQQRSSPDARRRLAHAAPRASLPAWVRTATRLLRPRGTLTLIWRADGVSDVLAALGSGYGGVAIRPIHPRPDAPAIRVIVHAVAASGAPLSLLPGLMLNDDRGHPTSAAEAVLRGSGSL